MGNYPPNNYPPVNGLDTSTAAELTMIRRTSARTRAADILVPSPPQAAHYAGHTEPGVLREAELAQEQTN